MKLTKTDIIAITKNDSDYLNAKGAKCYYNKDYKNAMEYYHLASSMGNDQACSNLGYCYLYGRDTEPNTDLAIAYFEIAAKRNNIEACYKLGDIYGSTKWGKEDKELSIYYYRLAASILIDDDWESEGAIAYCHELRQFPSLCFALGREMLPNGDMNINISQAYQFLRLAEEGYRIEIANGGDFYQKPYESVISLLNDSIFDDVRKEIDLLFDEDEEDNERA